MRSKLYNVHGIAPSHAEKSDACTENRVSPSDLGTVQRTTELNEHTNSGEVQ